MKISVIGIAAAAVFASALFAPAKAPPLSGIAPMKPRVLGTTVDLKQA